MLIFFVKCYHLFENFFFCILDFLLVSLTLTNCYTHQVLNFRQRISLKKIFLNYYLHFFLQINEWTNLKCFQGCPPPSPPSAIVDPLLISDQDQKMLIDAGDDPSSSLILTNWPFPPYAIFLFGLLLFLLGLFFFLMNAVARRRRRQRRASIENIVKMVFFKWVTNCSDNCSKNLLI